jgi:Fe-S-cluster containining protein
MGSEPADRLKNRVQTECNQCGVCCEKGGPALHVEDLLLVKNGIVPFNSIITIRRGEFVHDPVTDTVVPSKTELLKISGSNGTWTCLFYDRGQRGCSIYENRPLACKTLKCWDTGEILKLSGSDLLSRLDLVGPETELGKRLIHHESFFPFPHVKALVGPLRRISKKVLKNLERTVNGDLNHRAESVGEFHLSVAQELFYFGRPIFQLLEPFGFTVRESGSGIKLKFKG